MSEVLATTKGREFALKKLAERRAKAEREEQINNADLHAGSPMYYYCKACGLIAEVLPESHFSQPKGLCDECWALKELGWLE